MTFTKLLTFFMLLFLVGTGKLQAQCSLITKNGSSQDPKTVCAPVDFTMDVWFKLMLPVDTSLVVIRFVWNDGMGSETTVSGNWNAAGDSVWAVASHIYPPTDECSRTADAYLIYDGEICSSSGHQEQTFSTWGTDEENSGVLSTDPVVAYFCEGEDIVNVTFDDNSTFNCNIGLEPDNPNRYYRWVQFIYNTYNQGGDRIPSVTVDNGAGTTYSMTDASGNFLFNHSGPIIRIPIPADGPNQTSYAISAPAGAVAGDIFEITMRNWNVCNPYDNIPTDATPPSDLINGDNAPIETTARIEIIAPTPVTVNNLFEFCTGDNITLTANAGPAEVRWYSDAALTNLLHVGNNFDPEAPPYNLDNSVAGSYSFWVTSFEGICESAPHRVDVEIYQSPLAVFAGNDVTICADSILINATPPSVGIGTWTTPGGGNIENSNNPTTLVRNLDHGLNVFTWTVANGICQTNDQVDIISDIQPDPAMAGPDDSLCSPGNISLAATPPNLGGNGHWLVIEGFGTPSDTANPSAQLVSPSLGNNALIWRISSQYGACPVTQDTVNYFVDLDPGTADAGPNIQFCEVSSYAMVANAALNSGTGTWNTLSGSNDFTDVADANAVINNLNGGNNQYTWTLESRFGICPSSTDTLTITRDLSPGIAQAGPDVSLCLQNADTLAANSPTIGSGQWTVLVNPSGNPPVFSPNASSPNAIISVLPGNEGEYTLQWTLQNSSCISRDTLQVDFGIPPPPGFAGSDSTICGLTSWLQSNTFAQGHGIWTQLNGPETASFSPNGLYENPQISVPAGGEGVYNFEWRLVSGACAPSADSVQVTFLGAPQLPFVAEDSSCGAAILNLAAGITEPHVVVDWFASSGSTSPFHRGESFTTPLLSTSETYYVETYDTLTGCHGPRLEVEAKIFTIPAPPALINDTLCGPGSATLMGSIIPPAQTIQWFDDASASMVLGEGTTQSEWVNSSRYFWAQAKDTLHGCTSTPDSLFVTVHPAVPEPVAINDSACGTSDIILRGVKSDPAHIINWYTNATSASPFDVADSIERIAASVTDTFWIEEVNDSTQCRSTRVPVQAIIHAVPGIPVLADTSSCGPAAFLLSPLGDANTSTFRWYNQAVDGTLIQEATSLNTGLLNAAETFWVSGIDSTTGCEGLRNQVEVAIYPLPAPLSILGPTLVLLDQSGIIFSTSGSSSSTYNWTIPSQIDVLENMNDFVRLGFPNTGSYTISTFETTEHGCIGNPTSHPITVINDSIAVDIGTYSQAACTNVDFEIQPYLFGGTPPYIYSWSGDVAYLSSTNSLFTTFSPPGVGTYYLKVQVSDVNLKMATDSVEITVYTSPTATISTKDRIVCVGDELVMNVNTTGYSAVSHLWTGPIHQLNSYSIQNPTYTPHQPDTVLYRYELTDINGCKAWDSTKVYSDIPVAYFELLTEPGCSPLEVNFNNLSQRAVGNSWNFGDGAASYVEVPTHAFINQSPEIKYYPVTLEVVSALGCRDEITQYAMVWPNPVATLDAIPEEACSPANITLFTTPGNLRYHWDFGDGITETTGKFSATHTYANSGYTDEIFTAKVITESSLNCIDSAFLNLNIYASPNTDFTITPPSDTFPSNAFVITNLTEGTRWSHSWSLGDGRTLNMQEPGTVLYENPGNYTVRLTSSTEHCSDSTSKTLYLHPAPPQAKFAGPEPGCMPHTINFINTSEYADEYLWEFGDGSVSTSPSPSYTYYQAGIYRVSLTVRGPGGESTYSDTARVHVLPNAFFDMAPRYVYVNDEAVNFFNLSEKADVFEWDFGDGTTSEELNPKHVYKDEGTYDVTLKVWTNNQCYDLYVMENAVFVEPSGVISFPNAFRPASPLEENRVFLPGVIDNVDDYHLMIYNRWGELIFESFNQEVGWDGTFRGETAKQDVYIWKVTGTYSDGRGFSKTGDVTLLY